MSSTLFLFKIRAGFVFVFVFFKVAVQRRSNWFGARMELIFSGLTKKKKKYFNSNSESVPEQVQNHIQGIQGWLFCYSLPELKKNNNNKKNHNVWIQEILCRFPQPLGWGPISVHGSFGPELHRKDKIFFFFQLTFSCSFMVFYFGKMMTFTSSFFFSLVFWLINIFTFFKLFILLFFFKQVDFDFSPWNIYFTLSNRWYPKSVVFNLWFVYHWWYVGYLWINLVL